MRWTLSEGSAQPASHSPRYGLKSGQTTINRTKVADSRNSDDDDTDELMELMYVLLGTVG